MAVVPRLPALPSLPAVLRDLIDKPARPAPAPVVDTRSTAERIAARLATETSGSADENFARTVLDAAAREMSSAPDGARNDTLNRIAFDLYGLAKGGRLDASAVTETLTAAAMVAGGDGLKAKEIEATLASAERMAEPKTGAPLKQDQGGAVRPVAPAAAVIVATSREAVPVAPATTTEAAAAEEEEPPLRRPFARVDLDITRPVPETRRLLRWLYGDGCFTTLQSEPGIGKSWLALWAAVQLVHEGFTVIYLDEEGGRDLIHERLVMLGADPAAVRRHFWLFCFESRTWDHEDQRALAAMLDEAATSGPVALAVLDSLPDHLTSAGLSEDKAQDVTAFMLAVGGRMRARGVATLMLDHLIKPQSGAGSKSRYARGSGAKLAKSDATLLIESDMGFDANNTGLLRLWKTKDRRGKLDLPQIFRDDDPLSIQVKPEGDRLLFEMKELVSPGGHLVTPERAAGANILRLFREKVEAGQWMSQSDIVRMLRDGGAGRRKEVVVGALDELATMGILEAEQVSQSQMYRMTRRHEDA